MNITDLTKTLTTSLGSNAANVKSNATSASDRNQDATSKALATANDRVEKQRKASEVQLSAFGQIKSSVAELQSSSKTLSEVKNTDTVVETKKVAQNFVNAFNKARDTATKATERNGTLADNGRAKVATNEVSRSLNSTSTNELKSIGITANKDGSLKIDQQKFEQAFNANPTATTKALADVGKQVEASASKQLEGNSNVNRSINTLSNQVKDLQEQQNNQQNLADNLQKATEQATSRLNTTNATNAAGIAAYQKIFSL
ncbi:MAG TPA: flagellar filament capping protein FliD [Rhodocyclaceae bacterium]|nr:flagellar filament capping protein FliD [Rhodocyclaceae bacterium]